MDKEYQTVLKDNPTLADLYCSVTGVGPLTAATLINDNKECRPVASPKNVTQTLALGVHSD